VTDAYADRWGVPVQASDGAAVLLLDQAIEDLVSLSGDPVGGAEAAADGELALILVSTAVAYAITASVIAARSASSSSIEPPSSMVHDLIRST
jgi:hypothetical protein